MPKVSVRLVVEPCDLWIGAYVDPERQRLYLLPVPCVGIVIEWGRRCVVCGCTERAACPGGCYWVAEDVCSACVVFDDDPDELLDELVRAAGRVMPPSAELAGRVAAVGQGQAQPVQASPDGPPIRWWRGPL